MASCSKSIGSIWILTRLGFHRSSRSWSISSPLVCKNRQMFWNSSSNSFILVPKCSNSISQWSQKLNQQSFLQLQRLRRSILCLEWWICVLLASISTYHYSYTHIVAKFWPSTSELAMSHPLETLSHAYKHGYSDLCNRAALIALSRPRDETLEALTDPSLRLRWVSATTPIITYYFQPI